jgi:hypothetical protein
METKPIQVKPMFYAMFLEGLKKIAFEHGYNLLINGSMQRDMDLVAVPWADELKPHKDMILSMVEFVGGVIHKDEPTQKLHGRMIYVIDIYRGGYEKQKNFNEWEYKQDPQYYFDISVVTSPIMHNLKLDSSHDLDCSMCHGTGWQFIPNFGGGGTTTRCDCDFRLLHNFKIE